MQQPPSPAPRAASAKTIARVQTWAWVLIYGGLLLSILGVFTRRHDPSLGWPMIVVGLIAAVAGDVLIWVRSRMSEKP